MGKAAENKAMATFWIEKDKWEAFKQLATSSGSTASGVLIDFVNLFLEGVDPRNLMNAANETQVDDLAQAVYEKLASRFASIERLEEVEGKLTASVK